MAAALLELETLDETEFEVIFTGTKTAGEIAEENGLRAKVRKEKEDKEAEERKRREEEEKAAAKEEEIAAALKSGKRVAFIDKKGNFEILKEMTDEFMGTPEDLEDDFEKEERRFRDFEDSENDEEKEDK